MGRTPGSRGRGRPSLARIESYLNTLLWLTPAAIDDMRRLNSLPG
jgi:hypothetical protein